MLPGGLAFSDVCYLMMLGSLACMARVVIVGG